jgi:hypothetical protein
MGYECRKFARSNDALDSKEIKRNLNLSKLGKERQGSRIQMYTRRYGLTKWPDIVAIVRVAAQYIAWLVTDVSLFKLAGNNSTMAGVSGPRIGGV